MSEQLTRAKENLERLREDFKDEPELLAVYEPSALYIVNLLEMEDKPIDAESDRRRNRQHVHDNKHCS